MRIGLHAFVGIEREPVPVEEVIDNSEGDVGVIADPRVREEYLGKDDEKAARD